MIQPWLCPSLILLLCSSSLLSISSSQQHSSPNIVSLRSLNNPSISPAQMPPPPPPSSSCRTVVIVVVATAVTALVIAGICFLLYRKYCTYREDKVKSSFRREEIVAAPEEVRKFGKKVNGLIVDENGRDIIYMRRLEETKSNFPKFRFNPSYEEEDEEKSVDMSIAIPTESKHQEVLFLSEPTYASGNKRVTDLVSHPAPLPPVLAARQPQLPPPYPSQPPQPPPSSVLSMKQTSAPPSLPTPSVKKVPAAPPLPPPPPPPPPAQPPLVFMKRNARPAPPPPRAVGLSSSLIPPPAPRGKPNKSRTEATTEESLKRTGVGQMKLKALHWDKVTATVDHSVVWNEINDGSLRFDDDLIETLFGYTTTNKKSPERNKILSSSSSSNPAPTAQVFILEPRKSQNTAIVLKSLTISRKEILDALREGQGLTTDVLEKLSKISPSQEEEAKILQFNGNPTKLADAESFLYYILKAIPSAFIRINAMLFRSNYDPDILHLKESLQTLELGCKELRTRGLFLKLLEAILKAGNRMNAGTSRGNAQGFNLTALRKLSDIKSNDGETTLLHFVVEQVVRSEGRRCVINLNENTGISNSQRTENKGSNFDSLTAEEREKEYLLLGLPALGGLSTELSNVKKAATIDYDSFINMCTSLTFRLADILQLVARCGNGEKGGFVREMKGFLEECEEELKVVREEQTRVMELVKRTTEYYQAEASKDKGAHPLQLFVIVKDFLDMVDQVGTDISRKLQKKKATKSVGSSPPSSPLTRTPVRLPNFHSHFLSNMSSTSSNESDDDF